MPLSANLLPLTPISAFRPRRWRGALLPSTAKVLFEVLEADKRPTAAVADFTEVRDVLSVAVSEDRSISIHRVVRSGPRAVRTDHRRAVHGVRAAEGQQHLPFDLNQSHATVAWCKQGTHAADRRQFTMSVTHPDVGFAPVNSRGFASMHPQLAPFLVAVGFFVATVAVALAFTGLPA